MKHQTSETLKTAVDDMLKDLTYAANASKEDVLKFSTFVADSINFIAQIQEPERRETLTDTLVREAQVQAERFRIRALNGEWRSVSKAIFTAIKLVSAGAELAA